MCVQTVKTGGMYGTICVFYYLRMRNAEFLVFRIGGRFLGFRHVTVALRTIFLKYRRFGT